jgi:hypothetical protein
VLVADLRWRNPNWYAELHRRARTHFMRRLPETQGAEQQLTLFDFVYLHRDNPAVRPFFEWQTSGRTLPDHLHAREMPKRWRRWWRNTKASQVGCAGAGYWLVRQPENIIVFRDSADQPTGFMALLALERTSAEDRAGMILRSRWPGSSWQRSSPLCTAVRAPPISASGWMRIRIRWYRPRRA